MANTPSPCSRPNCRDAGRVVLFAQAGEFDGRVYRAGQTILFCLRHGNDVYDAFLHRRDRASSRPMALWLQPFAYRLPHVRAAHHNPPGPATRRPWTSAPRATAERRQDRR